MKKYSKKIMLACFALFAVVVVALIIIFAFANRSVYYECTEYKVGLRTTENINYTNQLK